MDEMLRIAIVDSIGLDYNGNTVFERGLGGSESAVTFMAKELVNLGFEVDVYNNINSEEEDEYNGVLYRNISGWNLFGHSYDIIISSRSVKPLIPTPSTKEALKNAKLRILWMHDTFCEGDELIEEMVVNGQIDEIFTLSDFHTNYVTSCAHGKKRMFEVLKKHIWQTRNGVHSYLEDVDTEEKDPNLFVYNASITKGMRNLLFEIWPKIKKELPEARLVIIGGYYKWNNSHKDAYEDEFNKLINSNDWYKEGIVFTGIISQKEIAKILAKASLFLYPSAFPETSGISTLESLYYKTPLVTCRFGALEETAIDMACYKIDYPIEPNSLYPAIDKARQTDLFVELVLKAVSDSYLLSLKREACTRIRGLVEWGKIALEWKYHFRKKLGLYSRTWDYKKIRKQTSKVNRVFGRVHTNTDIDVGYDNMYARNIVVISPVWNAEKYIEKCIESVYCQNYLKYTHVIIDDNSSDNTLELINKNAHATNMIVLSNEKRVGALANICNAIEKMADQGIVDDESVIMLLDGDDWLVNDPEIFNRYNEMYNEEFPDFTYGSCWSLADNVPLIAQEYPEHIKATKKFKDHKFPWNIPYSHLRTFNYKTYKKIDKNKLLDPETRDYFKAGGDTALFYELLDKAVVFKAVKDVVVIYNDTNPLNDYKVNSEEQTKTARKVLSNSDGENTHEENKMKSILIAIPTAKYIESDTFKSIYDLEIPEGYKTVFQTFYGYNIAQVRNLIADWVVRGYDYLFAVDSDITFKPDTLKKLLAVDKDVVSGVYRQRKKDTIIELWDSEGRVYNEKILLSDLKLIEVGGCGFGCVLVKRQVLETVGYPQFEYHSALDHSNTFSEDADFCKKARTKGFGVYAHIDVMCGHIGSTSYDLTLPPKSLSVEEHFRDLGKKDLLPEAHTNYLKKMKAEGINPTVVYDIGACVLHWTNKAKEVWPNAKFIAFEAMQECAFLYQEQELDHHIGILSDSEKDVTFYKNVWAPGGNSYFKENSRWSDKAEEYYGPEFEVKVRTEYLDKIRAKRNFPFPDLIKMDVQGAELDILRGSPFILDHASHLILEIPKVDYNIGAPEQKEIVKWLKERGWEPVAKDFSDNGPDADWHFYNTKMTHPL